MRIKVFSIVAFTVVVFLIIASNVLVIAALVPSFMEKLSAFEEITEESYAALVHTDDITQNKLKAKEDTKAWLDYILEQDPQAQIILQGQSMGAACALLMAEEELPKNVIAVVSDCAFSDAYEMFQKQMKDWFGLPAFPLLPLANQMLQLRGGYDLHNASPIKNMDKIQIPVLFIHGSEDELIPAEMTREMYEAAVCEKELLIMAGAGHAQSQDKDPELYYETIFSFLKKIIVVPHLSDNS